jgi:outer membrane receptor protein involved in Fe transport
VIQSPVASGALSRLRLSLDWYDITIKDAIGAQTIGAVQQQCFDPLFNPAITGASYTAATGQPNAQAVTASQNQYCQLLPRNPTGQLGNVQITYANSGRVHLQGIDAQLDWGMDVGPGTVSLNVVGNYQIDFESSSLYPQIPLIDYVGTTGPGENGLNPNVFEWRFLTNLGYSWDAWRIGLQWQYYSGLEDGGEAAAPTPNTAPYPDYNIFHLNGSYQLSEDIGIRFGVDNLFNKAPPIGQYNPNAVLANGQLPYVAPAGFLTGTHDTNGRRYYVGANVRF